MSTGFDPERLLTTLARHDVEMVLIGGLAGVAHGSPLPTTDLDVTPRRTDDNLERLTAALRELGARIRTGEPEGVVFPITAAFLDAQPYLLNLTTTAGDLDLVFTPAGFPGGYDELVAQSRPMDLVAGGPTQVATLDAVIASKERADRTKDRRALPYLLALREELDGA